MTTPKSPSSLHMDKALESLSALVDNEAPELDLGSLLVSESSNELNDLNLKGKWHRYHLVGALMRKELQGNKEKGNRESCTAVNISENVSAALLNEASLVPPSTEQLETYDKTLESFSAVVDGEGSTFEQRRLLDIATSNSDGQNLESKWQSYHLAGALLRKEVPKAAQVDLSGQIAAAIADEEPLSLAHSIDSKTNAGTAEQPGTKVVAWKDWVAKSAIAASVALAVVAGVQFTQNGALSPTPVEDMTAQTSEVYVDPVVQAPSGFELPAPIARNVSLGNLVEPSRKLQTRAPAKQQFLSNTVVEAELEQLFLEHAELSSENGKFGLMPMARAAKMIPPTE